MINYKYKIKMVDLNKNHKVNNSLLMKCEKCKKDFTHNDIGLFFMKLYCNSCLNLIKRKRLQIYMQKKYNNEPVDYDINSGKIIL